MRTPVIAGNWKMNETVREAVALVKEMLPGLRQVRNVERVLCPPFVALTAVKELLADTDIRLGAQNMHWANKGAYTGEISPLMLKGLCQYVIIGHSERRQHFGETDRSVNEKVKAALAHGLTPIVCVGETLEQNEAGQTKEVVGRQVRRGLAGLTPAEGEKLIVAYEPIWTIGTGKPASGVRANDIIGQTVRVTLAGLFGEEAAEKIRIQYGGSVRPANVEEFMVQPEIDGALVGGASLNLDFVQVVRLADKTKRAIARRL
jgi:triosephosphate isomerase